MILCFPYFYNFYDCPFAHHLDGQWQPTVLLLFRRHQGKSPKVHYGGHKGVNVRWIHEKLGAMKARRQQVSSPSEAFSRCF